LPSLNYHHLQYFWAVAREGNLTRAARRLHVSQSALSTQIRQLEDQLGQDLFERTGRRLVLTEAGRLALSYADQIFSSGMELLSLFREGRRTPREVIRIGAVGTLSRNFQDSFLKPLLMQPEVKLVLHSGSLNELLGRLANHALDLVLSNTSVQADSANAWRCQRIARQPVSVIGRMPLEAEGFNFPEDLSHWPLLLPGASSGMRSAIDVLAEKANLKLNVVAEVDDMAMLRLLARELDALALLPSVVVRDELRAGTLREYCVVPGLYEDFHAITVKRHFQHPLVNALLTRSPEEILGLAAKGDSSLMPAARKAGRKADSNEN
jgi:LysR family transcriptional regulator, transcriptional activator of nhaA